MSLFKDGDCCHSVEHEVVHQGVRGGAAMSDTYEDRYLRVARAYCKFRQREGHTIGMADEPCEACRFHVNELLGIFGGRELCEEVDRLTDGNLNLLGERDQLRAEVDRVRFRQGHLDVCSGGGDPYTCAVCGDINSLRASLEAARRVVEAAREVRQNLGSANADHTDVVIRNLWMELANFDGFFTGNQPRNDYEVTHSFTRHGSYSRCGMTWEAIATRGEVCTGPLSTDNQGADTRAVEHTDKVTCQCGAPMRCQGAPK